MFRPAPKPKPRVKKKCRYYGCETKVKNVWCKMHDPANKKPIRQVSKKRSQELRLYKPIRDQFLIDNPKCQIKLDGCTGKSTEVHHTEARENWRLLVVDWWKATCRSCHNQVSDNDKMAKELGHSKLKTITRQKPQ